MSENRQIVVADIGGTHARFAIATLQNGALCSIDHVLKLKASDHPSLQTAWEQYRRTCPVDLPSEGALAVASRIGGDVIYFTNSSWMIRPAQVPAKLGLKRFSLVNDFGAVCHAVQRSPANDFAHICGPDTGLPHTGLITVIGPGTGLGVAFLIREGRRYQIFETEGGHADFSPLDEVEDRILHRLRKDHRRVSVERVIAGSGLQAIYHVMCEIERQTPLQLDDRNLWSLALAGSDPVANAALDRFCLCLGAVAGDFVLTHGAHALVIAGGLGHRIGDRLSDSGFRERFTFKGRFASLLETIPVYRILQNEPGLSGAAAAFAKEYIS